MEASSTHQNNQLEQASVQQEADKAIAQAYQAAADFMKELEDY